MNKTRSSLLWVILSASLALALAVIVWKDYRRPLKRQARQEPVIASTWGWATLMSEPVPVDCPRAPNSHDNIGLSQVKFQMSDLGILTALVNVGQMPLSISPPPVGSNHWSKGDQVLVVCIPGQTSWGTDGRGTPSTTYMVVDYCPKK